MTDEDSDGIVNEASFSDDGSETTRKSLMRLSCLIILHVALGISISDLLVKIETVSEWKIDTALLIILGYLYWRNWQFEFAGDKWRASGDTTMEFRRVLVENAVNAELKIYSGDNSILPINTLSIQSANVPNIEVNDETMELTYMFTGSVCHNQNATQMPLRNVNSKITMNANTHKRFINRAKRRIIIREPKYVHTRLPVYLARIACACLIINLYLDVFRQAKAVIFDTL